jgi:Fe2+ or Zn2+ uptake regulation protein
LYRGEKMKKIEFKKTRQRQLILEVLDRTDKLITAEEVFDIVRGQYPKVSLSTIYRNLDMLFYNHYVTRYRISDGKWQYQLKKQGHYHQVVCTHCCRAIALQECPMTENLHQVLKDQQFEVTGHKFEVYGICKECQVIML